MTEKDAQSFTKRFVDLVLGKRIISVHFFDRGDSSFDFGFDDGSFLAVYEDSPEDRLLSFHLVTAENAIKFDTSWREKGTTFWLEKVNDG
jgi:hypothetical protein